MYPTHYIQYLLLFHIHRDYFECHEIMEEYWKKEGKGNSFWKGLILIAVLFYHYRRRNVTGAKKLIPKAIKNIQKNMDDVYRYGIDGEQLVKILQNVEQSIFQERPYRPTTIPIIDRTLLQLCSQFDPKFLHYWTIPIECTDLQIVHKHLFQYDNIHR